MFEVSIPGYGELRLEHLVTDYNGTLARDGTLLEGVEEAMGRLSGRLRIHVVSADTFGTVRESMKGLPCEVCIIGTSGQDAAKRDYVRRLGSERVAAVGNGRNDRQMLKAAALGIAVILGEGAAPDAIQAADIVCTDIVTALDLLVHPLRLVATLRS